jgi:bacteriorhodopsin
MNSDTQETFVVDDPKEKEEKIKNPVQYYVKFSFMITYILLLTTATVTFIEALRTNIQHVRHVLNLETCISLVAGYFYSVFVTKIEDYGKKDIPIDWSDISKTRYIDWAITTPLMLLVLSIVLGFNIGKRVHFGTILLVILLNYAMLYIGYLGETEVLERWTAMTSGFIPFFAMFGLIFAKFVYPKYLLDNYILFGFFVIFWAMYGLAYLFSEEYKNIAMNVLDCIAKCFVGIGLWAYYIRILSL